MDQQKAAIVWICIVVFAATCIITLLGITNKINIAPTFLKRLFAALILEIITICLFQFKSAFSAPNDTVVINFSVDFKDSLGNQFGSWEKNQLIDSLKKTDGITIDPPVIMLKANQFMIRIPKSFIDFNNGNGSSLNVALSGFEQVPIPNDTLRDKFAKMDGKPINLNTITLRQLTTRPIANKPYNPNGSDTTKKPVINKIDLNNNKIVK